MNGRKNPHAATATIALEHGGDMLGLGALCSIEAQEARCNEIARDIQNIDQLVDIFIQEETRDIKGPGLGYERVAADVSWILGETPMGVGKRPDTPDMWDKDAIVARLATGLEIGRKEWCGLCVDTLKSEHCDDNKASFGDLLCIKAFQLLWVSMYLAEKQYVVGEDAQQFVTALYRIVCNDKIEEVLAQQMRYREVENDSAAMLFRFTVDVSSAILGGQIRLDASLSIAPLFPAFVNSTRIAVAIAFGDDATVQSLMK